MCGFVVIHQRQGGSVDQLLLEDMTQSLVHRGPDDVGFYTNGAVGMGFRRLAILDLSDAGHQPMVASDESAVLVFNGEIFNYIELRKELIQLGHTFRSSGDAEVLLKAYLEWGHDCTRRLNGEWAFVVYDRRRKLLFGSRDRFAIKPLYRLQTKTETVWASEIKSLLLLPSYQPTINWSIAADYFAGGRIDHSTSSFFEGIESFPAATAFQVSITGEEKRWRYWSIPSQGKEPDSESPAEEFAELFEDSVALRLRSDVPVAVCLSGGLDSTSIICSMHRQRETPADDRAGRIDAFSYHHNDYDETEYLDATIAQTKATLHSLEMDQNRLWDMTDEILQYQDEPVHSLTAMVGFQLMKMISDAGVRVVLNGQGADEAYAGYDRYFRDGWYGSLCRGRILDAWRDIREYADAHGGDPRKLFIAALDRTLRSPLRLIEPYRKLSKRRTIRRLESHPWFSNGLLGRGNIQAHASITLHNVLRRAVEEDPLPLYLRIEDRNSMAHSVEVRLPWLDYRLVEYGFSLPDCWKIRGSLNKFIVRESMRNRIPDNVQKRVDKMGFPVGMQSLLGSNASDPIADIIGSQQCRERGVFDTTRILNDLKNKGNQNNLEVAYDAFRVAQFEKWASLFNL